MTNIVAISKTKSFDYKIEVTAMILNDNMAFKVEI